MMKDRKKITTIFWVIAVGLCFSYFSIASAMVHEHDDIAKHPKCTFCGMDRKKFAHSRMLVTFSDHTTEGYCSLHCAALKIALKMGKAPTAVLVGDYGSKQLIPAQKAVWVVGGKLRGVMTHQAKWAFADRADAQAFIADQGGVVADYEVAMQTAYTDLYADTKMFWPKKHSKMQQRMKHGHQ